jgi:hypothetical protein
VSRRLLLCTLCGLGFFITSTGDEHMKFTLSEFGGGVDMTLIFDWRTI